MSVDEITAALAGLLVAGLAVLGPVLIRLLSRLMDTVGNALIDKLQDDRTRTRTLIAKDEIKTAFEMIGQTVVPEIKRAASDGKITAEERDNLRTLALQEAKQRLGPAFWKDLMERVGVPADQLDAWILAQLEANVFRSKQAPQD